MPTVELDECLKGLRAVVEYRRREGVNGWYGFDPWHIMAAFDVNGAAEAYCEKQNNAPDAMWEYRWRELAATND